MSSKNVILNDTFGNQIFPATTAEQVSFDGAKNVKQAIDQKTGHATVANTAADMTDMTAIYVYTGSEEGYEFGHWYYYDGSAWTDGGEYTNTTTGTDTTLTVYGKPADGKATGDAIQAVSEDLQEYADIFTSNVDRSVQSWLEEHPEATTTVEDGSLTETKFANALKQKVIKDYVTPEMYGAVGNGIADDTVAVQAAFDSGKNVCLPNKYMITSTLVWDKSNIEPATSRNIFGFSEIRYSTCSSLFFNLLDRTTPCIELRSGNFTIQNVSIKGVGNRDQILFKTNITPVDVDMSILNCSIHSFDLIVDIVGRGIDMSNCFVATCQRIAKIAWKEEGTSVYHNDETGQRAYNFCNNRFHSMSATTKPLIEVVSGNVYGLRFINNNFDRGYSSLILANQNIKNWLISGNTFNGVMGYGSNKSFITFLRNVEQLTISNNTFTQVETATATNRIISIGGTVNGFVFVGNSFGEIQNTMLAYFGGNVKNSVLCNNLLLKNSEMTAVRSLFTFVASLTVENTTICNNVIGETSSATSTAYNEYILRCSGALTLRNVKMIGNVKPYANTTLADYSIGTPTIDRCIFDWLFTTS